MRKLTWVCHKKLCLNYSYYLDISLSHNLYSSHYKNNLIA